MNIVCIGAHPDDPEYFAGATLALFARGGHRVLAVSLTNGDAGHYETGGGALARRRLDEARRAAFRGGYESRVLDHHDGELMADLTLRKEVTRIIRGHEADIVFTHRPNDYHPDHRYAGQAVQDAAFMVTVPHFCADVPALRRNPLFLYLYDPFRYPVPFEPDVAVATDAVMNIKWDLLDGMTSQVYEWLPWLDGLLGEVPPPSEDGQARRRWLEDYYGPLLEEPAAHHRERLREWWGDAADPLRFVELFQVCEYGSRPNREMLRKIFAFPDVMTGA